MNILATKILPDVQIAAIYFRFNSDLIQSFGTDLWWTYPNVAEVRF